jgi:hypothetical protein
MKKTKPQRKSAWPQPFRRIKYADLKNTRRRENYNFAKLCGVMADYGFNLLRLSDDWEGADAIAVHIDGKTYLRVQLKGAGLTFEKKYLRKDIWMACPSEGHGWYVYPHDSVLAHVAKKRFFRDTASWREKGQFKWTRKMPEDVARFLDVKGYKLS